MRTIEVDRNGMVVIGGYEGVESRSVRWNKVLFRISSMGSYLRCDPVGNNGEIPLGTAWVHGSDWSLIEEVAVEFSGEVAPYMSKCSDNYVRMTCPYASTRKDANYDEDFNLLPGPFDMTGWVRLDGDSGWLYNWHGKYKPGLTIISPMPADPSSLMVPAKADDYNLPRGSLKVLRGNYWLSKKGSHCFAPEVTGQFVLLRDDWGGSFNSYRGGNLEDLKPVYYRRASSNGGGTGYDYAVVKIGAMKRVSLDDI